MLKLKKVKRYSLPMYPRGKYYNKPRNKAVKLAEKGLLTAALIGMVDSCTFVTEGIPTRPPMITEDSARIIINKVFSDSGIILKEDTEHLFIYNGIDSLKVNLDGYNDSLKIGYEYISEDEDWEIKYKDKELVEFQDSSKIKLIDEIPISEDAEMELEQIVIDFIETLISQGNI